MNKTLAEWANEQQLFQALAKMLDWRGGRIVHVHDETWSVASKADTYNLSLVSPASCECDGIALELEPNGKWIDA